MKSLGRFFDFVENTFASLAIIILIFITGSVCLEVVMRYGFDNPLIWVVEVSENALLFIAFLGAAWVLRNKGHVQVDILINSIRKKHFHRLGILTSLIGVAVSAILAIWGAITTWDHWMRGIYKPTVLEIPSWILLIVIPIGSFLLGIRFIRQAITHWREEENNPADIDKVY
ncbi:MAG: hypothetical protein CMM74_12060 [Rhodospirillaceae bacterium]|jgi:TRAP-type C4-dicarboxylate transport system permease small subunit|nr:hypothetical protein [Rhodospirillaceae bacterium]|tara:strand:- start:177 stop:692 length:516 start_codon:yes stop_codon:yes gene_type:complete